MFFGVGRFNIAKVNLVTTDALKPLIKQNVMVDVVYA